MRHAESRLERNLQILLGGSLVLHIVVAVLFSPGYYLFSLLLGLSSGTLAVVMVAVVRNKETSRMMYLAVIAMWVFWCGISLWKNAMLSRIDALISTFFTIVIYCELCLGLAYYSKWQFSSKALQFPLAQIFGWTAFLAAVSFLWSTFPEAAPHVARGMGTILPAIAGCVVLPLADHLRTFAATMAGSLVAVVGTYGFWLPMSGLMISSEGITSSELLVASVSQWVMVAVGGSLLLWTRRDEETPEPLDEA